MTLWQDDHAAFERPRKRSRPRTKDRPDYSGSPDALVASIDRGRYRCLLDDGTAVTATKARILGRRGVIVGDRVKLDGDVSGAAGTLARIVEVSERRTWLRRSADDADTFERPIVANADQLMIVTALADPEPRMGMIDRILVAAYDALAAQAAEFKPLVIVAGYSAYPRRIDFAKMREIADSVGAVLMVDMAHFAGLVAGKVFTGNENPVPFAQVVTTTTHKSLRGPRGGLVLATKDYAGDVDRGCPMVLGGPLSHIMAAKAVALAEARTEAFRDYAHKVVDNARALAEGLLKRGGTLVTGGTDNHIVLLDVSSFGLTGRQAESALLDSGIVTNRNSVPNDPNGAWYTSGIRLGTPALTSRGCTTSDMDEVAAMITDVLKKTTPTTTKDGKPGKAKYELAQEVADGSKDRAAKLLDLHPLYPGLTL